MAEHPPPASGLTLADGVEPPRYEAHLGDDLAGTLDYVVKRDRIALIHTEVAPSARGQGIAAALAQFAIDDARRRGRKVIVLCPYVRTYLERHPAEDVVVSVRPPSEDVAGERS